MVGWWVMLGSEAVQAGLFVFSVIPCHFVLMKGNRSRVAEIHKYRNTQLFALLQMIAVVYQWWSLYLVRFVAFCTSVSVQRTFDSCYLLT